MENSLFIRRLVVGALSANCYVIGTPAGDGIVIDPGGNADEIYRVIKQDNLKISTIILTHGHSDHIAALRDIQDRTGAEVAIHAADADFLRTSSQFGISYRMPRPPDILLHDGDTVSIGGVSFTIIHTPGHTPGSICILEDNRIFTGDTLFRRGIGTTLMPGSSRRQLLSSIQTRLMALPDETVVHPGHGKETTIGAERHENPYVTGRYGYSS
ncbi:MAG: MBL fold metallo-hydrolase [Dehalococcoidales bacterium]|nr:MBL fold metallo-hydrolase [Dehalococcoidales bacterium]